MSRPPKTPDPKQPYRLSHLTNQDAELQLPRKRKRPIPEETPGFKVACTDNQPDLKFRDNYVSSIRRALAGCAQDRGQRVINLKKMCLDEDRFLRIINSGCGRRTCFFTRLLTVMFDRTQLYAEDGLQRTDSMPDWQSDVLTVLLTSVDDKRFNGQWEEAHLTHIENQKIRHGNSQLYIKKNKYTDLTEKVRKKITRANSPTPTDASSSATTTAETAPPMLAGSSLFARVGEYTPEFMDQLFKEIDATLKS